MAATRGFTLIELLVVIAIIGILSSVVLASLNTARQKGADAAIKSNMTNARPQAELYYDSNSNSYASICGDTTAGGVKSVYDEILAAADSAGVPFSGSTNAAGDSSHAVCNDSATAWAAQVPLKATSGTFFCVDSSGQAVQTTATVIKSTGDYSCAP